MMKKLILILFIAPLFGWAQNYGKDLTKLINEFAELNTYQLSAKVHLMGIDNYSFYTTMKYSNHHGSLSTMDDADMLLNSHYDINIDHLDKSIYVQKGDYKFQKSKEPMGINTLQEAGLDEGSVEFAGDDGKLKTYIIHGKPGYEKIIVKISKTNFFFKEIEVVFAEEMDGVSSYRVEYTEVKKNASFDKSVFDEKNWIKKTKNGGYVGVGKYSEYTVILQ